MPGTSNFYFYGDVFAHLLFMEVEYNLLLVQVSNIHISFLIRYKFSFLIFREFNNDRLSIGELFKFLFQNSLTKINIVE